MIKIIKKFFANILFFIAAVALFSAIYTIYVWGDVYFEQILITLDNGISGTGNNIVNSYIYFALIPAIVLTLIVYLINIKNIILVSVSCVFLFFSLYVTSFFDFIANKNIYTDIYKTEYVNPKDITFHFPDKKRNLIILYLESMERDYSNPNLMGKNLIPNLTNIAETEISFNGFKQLPTQDYTIASIISGMCAIPYKHTKIKNYTEFRNFLPTVVCFPDILKQNGYKNYYIQAADLSFARKGLFFETHSYDYVKGLDDFEELYGINIEEHKGTSWGLRDSTYYANIKKHLIDIAKKDEPFVLTMLTLDTHGPDIYLDEKCEKTNHLDKDIISCADKMVAEFIEWIKQQDFYENTTLVVMADHIATGLNKLYPKHKDRQIVNLIINSASEKTVNINRKWTSFDIAPTILNSIGVEFADGKFGLGRSLFNSNKTLYETYEDKFLNEILKAAKEYDQFNQLTYVFAPKYYQYDKFDTYVEGNENIENYASVSDVKFGTIWLDTLSFTLPQSENDILLNIDFKVLFMEKNRRVIKVFANDELIDTLVYNNKTTQPIQQQIKIPAKLIKEDKKLKIDFRGDDLGANVASIGLGVLRFKIDTALK